MRINILTQSHRALCFNMRDGGLLDLHPVHGETGITLFITQSDQQPYAANYSLASFTLSQSWLAAALTRRIFFALGQTSDVISIDINTLLEMLQQEMLSLND